MVQHLVAAQFHRFMTAGRTSPALCGCEDDEGNRVDDFVVKLRGGLDNGQNGLLFELVASRLATHFGLASPDPALVSIDPEFADLVALREPKQTELMRKSIGLNFGSRLLLDATEWPVDMRIPDSMRQTALNIFAFDALIQNPDRRFENQNLLIRSNDIFVFDHELAFSFIWDILPSPTPWRLQDQLYLRNHVFYTQLRKKPIDLTRFVDALAALPVGAIQEIVAEVPREWNNEILQRIDGHLRIISDHATEFVEEIRRRLA